MTLAALGLEEQAVRDYIKQNKPTYPQFEAWVKKNAKSLTQEAIEKHNAATPIASMALLVLNACILVFLQKIDVFDT